MTLFVRVDGADITENVHIAGARFAMQTGPNPGDFRINVRDPDKTFAFRAGQSIEADFAGFPIFDGYVMQASFGFYFPVQDVTEPEVVEKGWTLRGLDINILFQKRFTFNQDDPDEPIDIELPAGTSDVVYINQILDHLTIGDDDLTPIIQAVASPNPDERGIGISVGDEWTDDMRRVSSMTGAVWGIRSSSAGRFNQSAFDDASFSGEDSNRHRIFYYEDDTSITAPFAISDTPDDVDSFGYSNFSWTDDGTRMVNDAKVWGAGPGSPVTKYAHVVDEGSVAEHGRWEGAEFRGDLFRQTSVDRYADSLVYGSPSHAHGPKDPSVLVKCRVTQPGLLAGQKVLIINETFGDEIVLPLRKVETTFIDRTQAFFDLEATWDIDGPRGIYDDWRTDPTPDEPIKEETDDNPCTDLGFLLLDGGSWGVIRSDPRLGVVDAVTLGITSNFVVTHKNRYFQDGGFFKGDGIDVSETYAHFARDLPYQPTTPNVSLPPFGFTMQFQIPIYTTVPTYHDPSHPEFTGDLTKYPRFGLDVIFIGAGSATNNPFAGGQLVTYEMMRVINGGNYIRGRFDGSFNSISQLQGSWWNFERTPDGRIWIWPITESSKPLAALNDVGGTGFGPNAPAPPGRPIYIASPSTAAKIVLRFQTYQDVGEYSTSILITGEPGDPSNDLPLMERFLDGTWAHDRLPSVFGHTVYTYDYNFDDATEVEDGFRIQTAVQKPTFYLAQNATIGTLPVCEEPEVESGEHLCETPERLSDTEFKLTYGFVSGSTIFEVEGIVQRHGIDYIEDPAGHMCIFASGEVPSDASVYVCYEAIT